MLHPHPLHARGRSSEVERLSHVRRAESSELSTSRIPSQRQSVAMLSSAPEVSLI